jgi:hypothetical protein
MSLKEFGEGHKGAGSTPVVAEPTAVAPENAPGAGLQHIVDEKGVKRPLIFNSVSKKLEPAKFADEYDYPGAKPGDVTRAKNKWIGAGKAIIGETHDEQGNPIANEKVEAFNQPVRPEKFAKVKRPASTGTGAGSEYEAKLRAKMPAGPGTGKATRGVQTLINNASRNLTILNDHHALVEKELLTSNGDELRDHPAYASHSEAGGHLALAQVQLDLVNKSKKENSDTTVTNNHIRTLTDTLHTANKILHNSTFDTTKAGIPPIGTQVTDEDRAHALVELPMAKTAGKLNPTLKLGRGPMSQLENSRDTFDKIGKVYRAITSRDPFELNRYPGISKSVARKFFKWSQEGTKKGAPEFGETNPGPMAASSTSMGRPFDSIGFGGSGAAVQSSVLGSPQNVVKTRKLMVAVHPNPAPKGSFFTNDTDPVTGEVIPGTRTLMHNGKVITPPNPSAVKFVEFGKHVGLKVINKAGEEIPHMDENNKPMTWEELKNAGAHIGVQTFKTPVKPLPQSIKPKFDSPERARNWDTLRKKQRDAITAREDAAKAAIQSKIEELENEKTMRISQERAAADMLAEKQSTEKRRG